MRRLLTKIIQIKTNTTLSISTNLLNFFSSSGKLFFIPFSCSYIPFLHAANFIQIVCTVQSILFIETLTTLTLYKYIDNPRNSHSKFTPTYPVYVSSWYIYIPLHRPSSSSCDVMYFVLIYLVLKKKIKNFFTDEFYVIFTLPCNKINIFLI